jgi:hypothetical protein
VNGFSIETNNWVVRVSMPLLPRIRLPNPGMGLLKGGPSPLPVQNAPFGRRLPSVKANPSWLRIRAAVTLVFQSPIRLRMPMLN